MKYCKNFFFSNDTDFIFCTEEISLSENFHDFSTPRIFLFGQKFAPVRRSKTSSSTSVPRRRDKVFTPCLSKFTCVPIKFYLRAYQNLLVCLTNFTRVPTKFYSRAYQNLLVCLQNFTRVPNKFHSLRREKKFLRRGRGRSLRRNASFFYTIFPSGHGRDTGATCPLSSAHPTGASSYCLGRKFACSRPCSW